MTSTNTESIGRFSPRALPQQAQIKQLGVRGSNLRLTTSIRVVWASFYTQRLWWNHQPSSRAWTQNLVEAFLRYSQQVCSEPGDTEWFHPILCETGQKDHSCSPFLSKTTKQSYKHCSGQTIAIWQGQSNSNGDLGMARLKQTWVRDITAFKELSVRNISFTKTDTRNRNKKPWGKGQKRNEINGDRFERRKVSA